MAIVNGNVPRQFKQKALWEAKSIVRRGLLNDNGVTVGHAGGSQVAIFEIVSLYEKLKFFKNFKNAEILEVW